MSQDNMLSPVTPDHNLVSDAVPNYDLALDQKIRAYIETIPSLPSPTAPDPSFGRISPLLPPSQGEDFDINNLPDPNNQIPGEELLAQPDQHNVVRACSHLVTFRLCMARCLALHLFAKLAENKPPTEKLSRRIKKNSSKILYLATLARQQAEALGRRDLRARSEYWAGCGCAGLRDWETAALHFEAAINLDMPNTPLSFDYGLSQDEKKDVKFLLQDVTRRRDEWIGRKEEENAPTILEDFGIEANYWNVLKGPHWTPYRDFMRYTANQHHSMPVRPGKPPSSSEERARRALLPIETYVINQKLAVRDGNEDFRRTLSTAEWQYIIHGDENTQKNRLHLMDEVKKKRSDPKRGNVPPRTGNVTSKYSPPNGPKNLADELAQSSSGEEEEEEGFDDDEVSRALDNIEYKPRGPQNLAEELAQCDYGEDEDDGDDGEEVQYDAGDES